MTSPFEFPLRACPARAVAVLLMLIALLVSGAAGAQQSADGRNVEEVRVVGNERLETETIRFYISTREGVPFDSETAQLDYMALLNTNWFRNLVMRWEEGTRGGVVVIVEVEEKPVLRQIVIEGTDKVKVEDFLERLQLMEQPIRFNEAVNEQQLQEAREVLVFMLQGDEGLNFVQVDLELVPSVAGSGQDAIYQVIEGDEVRIAQVMFEGNTVFSQKELRWALKRTNETYILSFLNKNDRFSQAGYEQDMFGLRNMYFRQGYLDFNWGEPQVQVFTADGGLLKGERQQLAITIPVYEGQQYRVGEISVEGNTHFEDEALIRLFGLRPGDVLNVEAIQAASEAIQKQYTNAGYFQVAASPFPRPYEGPDGTPLADVIFRIQENAIYRVNRIEFEGNTNTRDFVLRRALNLHELARWDQSRFDTSLERLYQLGYFQGVEEDLAAAQPGESLDPDVPPDPEFGQVDVNLKVQEVGRNQITFGGGLSALEGGFVQFGYTTRNLFGYGQTLSLSGQVGQQRQNVRLSFADPYLFGKKILFGADLFRDALNYPDFEREGTGFSMRFGRPLNERETVAAYLEYNYEIIDIGDVGTGFGGINSTLFEQLFLTQGRRTTSSVRPFLSWQRINNPFLPSAGTRTFLSFEYAGGPFGGTLDFWKAFVRTTHWIPIVSQGNGVIRQPKQIIAINVRADWAQPHSGLQEIPIFERFFLGGSNSVRGTRLRSIGPIDERGNILGGTKAFQYNLEYIFQLNPSLRIKAFHDAGQAWLEEESVNLSEMRRTAGLEFEVFAPVFNVPFRFFWAYNFNPLELFGEQKSTFEFAIGSTF